MPTKAQLIEKLDAANEELFKLQIAQSNERREVSKLDQSRAVIARACNALEMALLVQHGVYADPYYKTSGDIESDFVEVRTLQYVFATLREQ